MPAVVARCAKAKGRFTLKLCFQRLVDHELNALTDAFVRACAEAAAALRHWGEVACSAACAAHAQLRQVWRVVGNVQLQC